MSMVPDESPDAVSEAYRKNLEGVRQFNFTMKLMQKQVYDKAIADAKKPVMQGSSHDTLLAAASAAAAPVFRSTYLICRDF